jgi:hypothetical protein
LFLRDRKDKEYKNRGENGRADLLSIGTDKTAVEINVEIQKSLGETVDMIFISH